MEEAICKTSTAVIQNENMSCESHEKEDVINLNVLPSPIEISPVKDENLNNFQTEVKEETKQGVNGAIRSDFETVINGESSRLPDFAAQKTVSPTLIESAFKVMKNLFSPDKSKSKSTTVLSPINQSLSGSPCSSLCIQGKTDLFSCDPETGTQYKVQTATGETIFKNNLANNEIGIIQSPLTLDPLNNTDESFLTTVSLIDESFHSAITHFDELGDALKNGANLMENILSNSQNLGLMDACNETLGNNESCLENTTLKIGSFTCEGNDLNNISVQSQEENRKMLSIQISNETKELNGSKEVAVVDFQCEGSQESVVNNSVQNEEIEIDVNILTKNGLERDSSLDIGSQKHLNTTNENADNYNEIKTSCGNIEMSDIFLSQSFKQHTSDNEIRVNDSSTSTVKECMHQNESESEVPLGSSNDERDDCVENCISTTTVILSTVNSADIDNMLMSLKADDSETNTSSLTSFESDEVTCSLENVPGKIPAKEQHSPVNKLSSESSSSGSENFFSLKDDKKTCVSDMNSANNKPDPTKFKLNKSDDFISCKTSKEPTETKKSSVDISLMKNSEASENSKELAVEILKAHNQSDIAKKEVSLHSHRADTECVISQQSYTILTTHDNSLNRPIIEPLNISDDQHQLQVTESERLSVNNCSNASFGPEELVKSSQIKQSTPLWEGHNESNQKFFRPSSLKLDSPDVKEFVWDEKNEKKTKSNFSKSDKAKQMFSHEEQVEFSPVNPVIDGELVLSSSVDNEMRETFYDTLSDKILQTKDLVEPNQSLGKQLGLKESRKSPDIIIHTLNQSFDKKQLSPESRNTKQYFPKSPDLSATHKLNQTFDKKSKTPGRNHLSDLQDQNKLNTTFDKIPNSSKKILTKKTGSPEVEKVSLPFIKKMGSPEIDRINQTFDRPGSPKSSQLNKTYDKPFGNNQLNRSFDKKTDSHGAQILNQTFDKKPGSPLLCEATRILDKRSESPGRNQNNHTFCKETDFNSIGREKKASEMSKNLEHVEVDGIREAKKLNIVSELEVKVENPSFQENKTSEKIIAAPEALGCLSSEDKISLASYLRAPESFDKSNKNVSSREINDSCVSSKSSSTSLICTDLSTVLLNEDDFSGNLAEDLSEKLEKIAFKDAIETQFNTPTMLSEDSTVLRGSAEEQYIQSEEKSFNFIKDDKSTCEPDLVQLIQEQFSSHDIEKICSVVHNLSSVKLGSDILKASEQFDKSFHGNLSDSGIKPSEAQTKSHNVNALSPQSFDFLSSIGGKPTGRDLSRESLYVKFDPLVQPSANSLIDFTKEGEALPTVDASPVHHYESSVCEQLLAISPQKKSNDIVPPLTPLSHKVKGSAKEDEIEKLNKLQNEIYFMKNLYAERERTNKVKMEEYETQIAKLTGESCMLEDKLKESNEREKSLVKKMKEQTQSIHQLKIIMEEYVKVISKLSAELETIKKENLKQTEILSLEKDSYMTHLQNTEAAFTDVHAKYEKSKKTILSLKANETMYRNTIAEQTQKMEEFKVKAREAQEKASIEFQKIQEVLNETKGSHSQEIARLRAQLRKTELKVEALQESLDQKIKENQQLTAICDELIEGKK